MSKAMLYRDVSTIRSDTVLSRRRACQYKTGNLNWGANIWMMTTFIKPCVGENFGLDPNVGVMSCPLHQQKHKMSRERSCLVSSSMRYAYVTNLKCPNQEKPCLQKGKASRGNSVDISRQGTSEAARPTVLQGFFGSQLKVFNVPCLWPQNPTKSPVQADEPMEGEAGKVRESEDCR